MRNPVTPIALAGVLAALLLSGVTSALASSAHRAGGGSYFTRHAPLAKAAIIGGAPAQAGMFASVAEILDIRGREVGQCTGTVVAANLVLTAGHCAENVKTGIA